MYCPMDGMEYREGITRCPQHDVDLVEDPPETDAPEPWLDRVALEGLPGWAAVVVALAGIVYAVSGAAFNLWAALATSREWEETGAIAALRFAQSGSWAIGLGAFGALAAAVLGRTYGRLTEPAPDPPEAEDADEEAGLPPESGDWFVPLVSTLTICFAVVWMAIAVAAAWKTRSIGGGLTFEADEGLVELYGYQRAAAACTLGSLAVMGSILMGRAHDKLTWAR